MLVIKEGLLYFLSMLLQFLILILEGATLNNFVLYPQIEEGSTATNYSEYKGIGYTSGSNENGSWVKYDDGTEWNTSYHHFKLV